MRIKLRYCWLFKDLLNCDKHLLLMSLHLVVLWNIKLFNMMSFFLFRSQLWRTNWRRKRERWNLRRRWLQLQLLSWWQKWAPTSLRVPWAPAGHPRKKRTGDYLPLLIHYVDRPPYYISKISLHSVGRLYGVSWWMETFTLLPHWPPLSPKWPCAMLPLPRTKKDKM